MTEQVCRASHATGVSVLRKAFRNTKSTVTPTLMDTFGVKLRSFARPCPVIPRLNSLPKKTATSCTWGTAVHGRIGLTSFDHSKVSRR